MLMPSCLNTLYSANTGLHAYSAWDAANSPKCTTTLFSFTNPVSWGLNSRVWHDPTFANPALPYFYSYGSQVFKVGQPYRREFGVKINYELKTNLIRTLGSWLGLSQNPVTVTPKILGPKDWQTLTQVPACIEPTMKDIGLVKYIYNVGSLPEPTKYLYLVGKNNSDKIAANDSVFSQYDYTTSTHKPITGLIHCLIKIATGSYVRASNDPQVRLLINTPQAALAVFGLGLLASIISIAPSVFGLAASTAVMSSGTIAATGVVTVNGSVWCGVVGGTLSTGGTLIVVALIALALYLLFRNRKKILEEPCKLFDKVYTNNDYLENGNTIYSNTGLTVNGITGFYTDGGYFYTTTNGLISSKEVSYTNMNGARTYSIAPDNPPYITGIQNFFLLPYVSGRPYEWTTGVYLNSPISTSAVSTAKVGDLNTPSTIDYEIPEGLFEASTQVEADNLAQEYLSGLTAQTIGTYLSAEQLPTASGITTIFTHEIKLENTEAVWPVFFDNADNLGLSVGKILYYDNNGIFSVLDGYYSISGNSGNFRTFYKTSGGTIIDYYDMTTSGATIVTSPTSGTLPVETTGQTYTSSWYFQGAALENVMYDNSNNINGFNETWNTSTFYSNEYVKRGMIDTPVSKSSLLTYVNNTTSYAFEVAPEGWYREIPNIFNENPFLIQSATTIYLDTIQNCSEDEYNGIYVTCVDESGNTMPSFYGVEGVLSVSTSSGVTTHDYVIENDDYRVLVPLGLEYINAITAATVTVTSTNPISGITFTDGTFYPCAVATPTPTPVVSPDVTPTPTVTPTKTPTQTPDCFCYEYLFTANDDTTASWTDCNSGAQSQFVSSGETIFVCVYPNSDIVGDGYTGTTGNVCGNPCITATPTPTVTPTIAVSQTPTPTPTPSSTPSNCLCYSILNEDSNTGTYGYTPCGQPFSGGLQILPGQNIRVCSETLPVNESLAALTITACVTQTTCNADVDCTLCS